MRKKEEEDDGIEKYLASISDFKEVFDTPAGGRVLRSLMHACGFMHSSHVPGDPYATAFNEGGRNVVIQILHKARIDLKKLEDEIKRQPERGSDVII